jgi:tetratricopeptide (TPR) repeat protein
MAFIWEACTTKQLVEKLKMESKLISANLKTLTEKGIIEKIKTNKKQHLYRISERFFNLWLIITQGNPNQKRKAKWLSIFLENWYDASDFKKLTNKHISNLKNCKTDWNSALLLSKGLCQSKYISVLERDSIIKLTENIKGNGVENCLLELPEKYESIIEKIITYCEEENYSKAVKIADSIENEEDGEKFYVLACLYTFQQKYTEAENYYLQAIEKVNIDALNNLANLYTKQQKYTEAENYYLQAIEKGSIDALYNLAFVFYQTNINKAKALKYINKAREESENINIKESKIIIEIWNGIFDNLEQRVTEIIESKEESVINELFFDLLVQQQKRIVLNLFEDEVLGKELQEKYIVFYYVSLILNKVQDDNLLLKIPPELQTTIEDVLLKIETKQKFYGY